MTSETRSSCPSTRGLGARSLLEDLEYAVTRQQHRIAELKAEVDRLAGSPVVGDRTPSKAEVEEVRGLVEVRERLDELSFFTRSTICSVHPAVSPTADGIAAGRYLDERSLRRGLSVRVVYDADIATSPPGMARLDAMVESGTQVRTLPGPLERLLVLDGRVAVLPIDPVGGGGALIVRSRGIVMTVCHLFEMMWHAATESRPQTPGPQPAQADLDMLRLLARGCTDDVAGRRIGVSGRVVRRRVSRLMGELDAGSRFAAGAAAVRRGWL